MNIGNSYKVKDFCWLLFPTKEKATELFVDRTNYSASTGGVSVAHWCSKQYNCEVTSFSPDSMITFLEEDRIYKKVLTSDGRIGWIWFKEPYDFSFEEISNE